MRLDRVLKGVLFVVLLSGLTVPLAGCASGPAPTAVSPSRTVTAQRGDLTSFAAATGSLAFARSQNLGFLVNGMVIELNAEEGDTVTKGQVLARLYAADFQKALDSAETAFRTAEIGLQDAKDAESSVKGAEADLQTADNAFRKITYPYDYQTFAFDVPAAIADINAARQEVERARTLMGQGPGSENHTAGWNQLLKAQDHLVSAEDKLVRGQGVDVFLLGKYAVGGDFWAVRAAQLAVDKARATLDRTRSTYQSGLDRAQATLQKATIDRDRARADLSNTVISAPFSGVVTTVNTYVGDEWRIGRVALTIAEPDTFVTDVLVDEADIPLIKEGAKATVGIGAASTTLSGRVVRIAPRITAGQAAAKYAVRVAVESPAGTDGSKPGARVPGQTTGSGAPAGARATALTLRQGLSVTVSILKQERKDVLLVPSQAVVKQGGDAWVQVSTAAGVEQREVKTGLSDLQNTEITEGLSDGEKVVVRGVATRATGPGAPTERSTPAPTGR